MLYAPAPGTIFDSFVASNGSFLSDFTVEIPVFFFYFNSASFISYSPTPGLLLFELPNLSIFPSI